MVDFLLGRALNNANQQMSYKGHRLDSLIDPGYAAYSEPSELNIGNVGFVGNVLVFYSISYVSYKSDVSDVLYLSFTKSTADITIESGLCIVKSNIRG
ncbi:MAG TPA: hypothetical protein VGK38_08845 [Prolixibacteraceae bacterium]|jgi:hypothetical protein